MARPISDEELQLKKRARRRLVGAIVLVSVVAVVLPMVLDSEPKRTGQSVDIQIPSPDSGEFKPQATAPGSSSAKAVPQAPPKAEPAQPEATAKSEAPIKPDAAKSEASTKPDVVAKAETPAATKAEPLASDRAAAAATEGNQGSAKGAAADKPREAAPSKSGKSAAPAKRANGAYVVQVAALADPGKAKELEKRMASAGVKTYTEVITTQAGEVTRVRAGPYATRDAAEKARAQLKTAGLEGKIVPK